MATESGPDEFARRVETAQPGALREFWALLRHNRDLWLTPVILLLLLLGALVILAGTSAAPLIYTLF
jgi:hypothetical protein